MDLHRALHPGCDSYHPALSRAWCSSIKEAAMQGGPHERRPPLPTNALHSNSAPRDEDLPEISRIRNASDLEASASQGPGDWPSG